MTRILYSMCPRYNCYATDICYLQISCCTCAVEMNVIFFSKGSHIVSYFSLIVELHRGCSFNWYNIMLCQGSLLRKSLNSFFHIMPPCLTQTHTQSSAHTCQSPAPAQNPSIASLHPLNRIQTPFSPQCLEGCFLLQPPWSFYPLLSNPLPYQIHYVSWSLLSSPLAQIRLKCHSCGGHFPYPKKHAIS